MTNMDDNSQSSPAQSLQSQPPAVSATTSCCKYGAKTACVAADCTNTRYENKYNLRFFRLPADDKRRNQWLTNCGRPDLMNQPAKYLVNRTICQLHFLDSQFMNAQDRTRLTWNALPTLFGNAVRKPEEVVNASIKKESVTKKLKPSLPENQDHAYIEAAPDYRKYMIMCSDLLRDVNEKAKKLEALEEVEAVTMDAIMRQARTLPPERVATLIGSLIATLSHTKCTLQSDTSDLGKLVKEKLVELQQEYTDASERPQVHTEVLLRSPAHPDSVLLGMRTGAAFGKGLYQLPGDYVRFGETWEAAATRAVLEETGYQIEEPEVCAVVETVRVEHKFHCISIFMTAAVINHSVEPKSNDERLRTGWQWCKRDTLPSDDLLFWTLQDLRRKNLINFDKPA
ncbi:uncharacterized protein LOC135389121 [Ornithodoros turicata]